MPIARISSESTPLLSLMVGYQIQEDSELKIRLRVAIRLGAMDVTVVQTESIAPVVVQKTSKGIDVKLTQWLSDQLAPLSLFDRLQANVGNFFSFGIYKLPKDAGLGERCYDDWRIDDSPSI